MPVLTAEQKNDLRKKVLMRQPLTLDEARDVIESARQGRAVAVLAGEAKSTKKKGAKGISDDQLDADLAGLGL